MPNRCFLTLTLFFCAKIAWGWGESGHRRVANWAAQLAPAHPLLQSLKEVNPAAQRSFLKVLDASRYELGHIANIPDTFWRNLDKGLKKEANVFGAPTHYFDADKALKLPPPKDYVLADFFKSKSPWIMQRQKRR